MKSAVLWIHKGLPESRWEAWGTRHSRQQRPTQIWSGLHDLVCVDTLVKAADLSVATAPDHPKAERSRTVVIPMNISAVEEEIGGTRFAGELRYLASVGSTNSLAMEAAQGGARKGVWIADEQTAGRGRGGHTWHSAAGDGLYVSALVVPRLTVGKGMFVSLAAGLAVQAAIDEASGLCPDLRWPNDLLLGGRKCAGILVESALSAGQTHTSEAIPYVVIGVGINVNHANFPEDLQAFATSLKIEAKRQIGREALLRALLLALESELESFDEKHFEEQGLLERFTAASTWARGKRVRVGEDGYTGVTAGLSAAGFLEVDATDGTRRTVLSGGVRELV